jgi:hypothetical protein
MAHLASTAPLSLLAAEALASGLARDAERFRHAGDDGTLLAERLAQVVSDLPPVLFEKVRPALRPVASRSDAYCSLACVLPLSPPLPFALPPFLLTSCARAQLVPHLDWHCTLALHKLASSLPKASKDLVARHLPYAQAEVRHTARAPLASVASLSRGPP